MHLEPLHQPICSDEQPHNFTQEGLGLVRTHKSTSHKSLPFSMGHNGTSLVLSHEFVRTDTDEKIYRRERMFGLSQLQGMTNRSPLGQNQNSITIEQLIAHPKWNKSYTPSAYIRTGRPTGGGLILYVRCTPDSVGPPETALVTKA